MKRKRVLVYGSFTPPGTPCGITASVNNFSASSVTKAYDLELVSTYRGAVSSRRLVKRLAFGVKLAATAAWRAVTKGADILDVHVVSGRDFYKNAAVMFAARLIGRPVVLRVHGGNFDSAYDNASPRGQKLIRGLLRLPDRVVVLSRRWAAVVSLIQPRANVTVIPNSIDCGELAQAAQSRHASASDILLLGNLCERKGHFDTLEAAKIVAKAYPKCRFLFAGAERDEGALAELQARTRELGLEANVEFLGPVFGDAKMDVLTQAGVFALASHVENMPVSLMEAMAAGLPIVASKVGAVPEMVEQGKTGCLFDPHDVDGFANALMNLLDDNERRREMGEAARKTAAKRWDGSVVAAITETMYRSLV